MKWTEIVWSCSREQAPYVEEIAFSSGASSVSFFEDSSREQAFVVHNPHIKGKALWSFIQIVVLLTEDTNACEYAQHVERSVPFLLEPGVVRPLSDGSWQNWQQYWQPIALTNDYWITPPWEQTPEHVKRVVIEPGQAFGTGAHATTQLCARWLAQQPSLQRLKVLDYGCGSGVLAILAALRGAAAYGVDIDEQALTIAQNNAARNQVAVSYSLPEECKGVFDIVVANILLEPLLMLKNDFRKRIHTDSILVFSGILAHQVDAIQSHYLECEWKHVQYMDEWALMVGCCNEVK